jgi:uroporphyrinogen-III decarboxylase
MATEIKRSMNPSAENNHVVIGAQSNDHSAHLVEISPKRFFTDAITFARVQLLVTEYYGVDAPINFWDVYNIEAEALGQKVAYDPEGIPDAEVNKTFLEMTGKLERAYFTAPFSLAVNIRGYENLVDDMFERPGFVHRLFEFLCDDVITPYIEVMRSEIGIPDLLMDGRDAWASPPMITLDMMDEYVVAYTERLRENLGDRVVTRGNWGDAKSHDPERFFSQKLQCSPDILSVLDPDLYEVGPQRVKAFADKHNTLITAGVDATLLKEGPVEAIVERIKLYIDKMARDGRCMIHLNQIPAETPPEHIHAAVAACHTYGRHPIPESLDDIPFDTPKRKSFAEFMRTKREPIST